MNYKLKLSKELPFSEEVGNSVSHGIGAFLMLILLPFSAIYTYINYDIIQVVGVSIFNISLFLMFMASAIYHSMAYNSLQKYVCRIIDHSMIFIAIAGSYTPIALSLIKGKIGIIVIVIQWMITVFGILYKIFAKKINDKISLILYLIMGWLAIFIFPSLIRNTSFIFMILIFTGGLLYSIGSLFYAKKKPYCHMIWHFFILAASICHYIAIVFFMN